MNHLQDIHRLRGRGEFDKALLMAKKALKKQPRNRDLWLAALETCLAAGDLRTAESAAAKLFKQLPARRESAKLIGDCYDRYRLRELAGNWAKRALKEDPRWVPAVTTNAGLAMASGLPEEATALLDSLDGKERDTVPVVELTAKALLQAGRIEEGIQLLEDGLALPAIASAPDRHLLWRLLGELHDRAGQPAEAMRAMSESKAVLKPLITSQARTHWELTSTLLDLSLESIEKTPEVMWQDRPVGGREMRLAFAIGPPRTGTTLFERLLEAHPDCTTADEPQLFDRMFSTHLSRRWNDVSTGWKKDLGNLPPVARKRMREGYERGIRHMTIKTGGKILTVDKSPILGKLLPFVPVVFPTAKFLCTVRDPRDAALSYYLSHSFDPDASFGIPLLTLESTYRFLMRLTTICARFEASCPGRVQSVTYENLVHSPETSMDTCFRFLDLAPDRNIDLTAPSFDGRALNSPPTNVRGKISAASVGKWRKYEECFSFLTADDTAALEQLGYCA